jgi:hypothetical protein
MTKPKANERTVPKRTKEVEKSVGLMLVDSKSGVDLAHGISLVE